MTDVTLTRRSPAKINLTLRLLGTRPDGYHELESLVALVDLCDELTVTAQEDGRYAFTCDDPTLPVDGTNLVLQAARVLARDAGTNHGADFALKKRIPAGAGLGGGSSNAALALAMLNDAWDLRYPTDRLARLGAVIGSDVPLFFSGPMCVLRGRGEMVERVPAKLNASCVLLLPAIHCATAAVYRAYDRLPSPPQRAALQDVLAAYADPERLMTLLSNDLEAAAFEVAPALRELAARAAVLARGPVRMTGSGSALFRLFADPRAAERFATQAAHELAVRAEVCMIRD